MRFAALSLVLVLVACARTSASTGAPDAPDADPPPFVIVEGDASIGVKASRVLGTCAGGPESSCHGLSAGDLHLPDDPPNLVDVPSSERPDLLRVKPFDPEASYLYLKVIGDGGIDGSRMPPDSPPLDAVSTETLRAWIEAGAPR